MNEFLTIADALEQVSRRLQKKFRKKPIPAPQLIEAALPLCKPSTKAYSIMPSDYCYNMHNKSHERRGVENVANQDRFLECVEQGEGNGFYLFRGRQDDHKHTGPLWYQFGTNGRKQVGEWSNGELVFWGRESLRPTSAKPNPVNMTTPSKPRQDIEPDGYFDPIGEEDERVRKLGNIVSRPGQADFRRRVLVADNRRCVISGCDVEEALDAAHIVGFLGPRSDKVSNGLTLRKDLHWLFDLGQIVIDPKTLKPLLQKRLKGTWYDREIPKKPIKLSPARRQQINAALQKRWEDLRKPL